MSAERQMTETDFQVIEFVEGFGVQCVLDAFVHEEQFETRAEAEEWIRKNAPKGRTGITTLEEIRDQWRLASGMDDLQLVITEYIPEPDEQEEPLFTMTSASQAVN